LKTKKISESYIDVLWCNIGEGMNIPDDLRGLNLNNYDSISRLVKDYLMVNLKEKSISTQIRTKNTLKYAINFWDEKTLERIYEEVLPEIELPTAFSCKEFYIKVWTLLFPNESYHIDNDDKSTYQDLGPLYNVFL